MVKTLVILVAHGSENPSSNDEVKHISGYVKSLLGEDQFDVSYAFLKHAKPHLKDELESLSPDDFKKLYIVPYFLGPGFHVAKDIPFQINQFLTVHPEINANVLPHIGALPGIGDLLCQAILDMDKL